MIVVDTETTGLEGDVVEVAAVWRDSREQMRMFASLCRPSVPIEFQAMAVHHITEQMVMGYPSSEEIVRKMVSTIPSGIVVAHNAEFDRGRLLQHWPEAAAREWICTYRCALHIWPDAPGHSNQVLRYYLDLSPDLPSGLYPHRALYDAIVTEALLCRMLENCSVGELLEFTAAPAVLHRCRFGKHRDTLWRDVPMDYLRWITRQGDMDADVQHTAHHYLRR